MSATALQSWRLDSTGRDGQSLIFVSDSGIPQCIYYGQVLPADESAEALYLNQQLPITGATLDDPVPLSLCPEEARGFMGHPGLIATTLQGERLLPYFQLSTARQTETGHRQQLQFECRDSALGLQLTITLALLTDSNVLVADSLLEYIDHSKPAVRIDWLGAPVVPVPETLDSLLDYAGRWCGEFQPQPAAWRLGAHQRSSYEGRTGHGHVPLLFCGEQPLRSTQGRVMGWHLGWSGGHRMVAEELMDGRRQVQFGAIHQTQVLDAEQPRIQTPPLYITHSQRGLNGVMHSLHRFSRRHLLQFATPQAQARPVHYNCWEAIYFDHDLDTLQTIASAAAALGAERFVLDDGWFAGRRHDRAALGDWVVDTEKYPGGLQPLIDHIHAQGMGFGLWVEPEMVNADSALYRAHPDWVLGPVHHPEGRQQLVLDLSHAGVYEYLWTHLSALLDEYPIEYLKWDHNRVCLGANSAQTATFYRLLAQLRRTYPAVEIESCASGGGRIDYGVLQHTQRVWLSDSNDALERWRIQHEAALLLVPEVTGSHVGPRHCHTSGRHLPMAFRAWVAASRHMGFEMDPRELTAEEQDTLRSVTQWWKQNRDWLFGGDLYRLDSSDDAVLAEMTVSADGQQFVTFAAQMSTSARNSTRRLCLSGLQAARFYRLRLRNPEQIAPNITRQWASPMNSAGGLVLSGQALMQRGISLPVAFPATLWVIEGTLV